MKTNSAIEKDLAKLEKIRMDAFMIVTSTNDIDWMVENLFWYIREYKKCITAKQSK